MLSQNAVDIFLNEKKDNWDYLKSQHINFIKNLINDFSLNKFDFKYEPRKHQWASLLAGLVNPYFLFLHWMGLGKSKIIIDLLQYQKDIYYNKKVLILVPNIVSIDAWETQLQEHSDFKYKGLFGSKEKRVKALKESKDIEIFILNYQGLQSLLTIKKKGEKRKLDLEVFKLFENTFDVCIFDEIHSSGCKNHLSYTFRLLKKLTKDFKIRYGLTGTPTGRHPLDLWAQFFLIDRGETLGETIALFRSAFFNLVKTYWATEYHLKKKLEKDLHNRIKHRSLRYAADEAIDLPEKVYIPIQLTMPKSTKDFYEVAKKKTLDTFKKDYQTIQNSFIKLRQISAGFIKFKNADDEEIIDIFIKNPKLEKCMELIEETPLGSKVVIFNEFNISGDILEKECKKNKIKYKRIYGKTKDKEIIINDFISKDFKVLILNSQSGATSLNLQCANYVIFYESPVSSIIRMQAEGRCRRIGSAETVFIYDLFYKGSIDERAIELVKEGKDVYKALIEEGI